MNRRWSITAAAGLVSFAGAFAAGWLGSPSRHVASGATLNQPQAAPGSGGPAQASAAGRTNTPTPAGPTILTPTPAPPEDATGTRAMTEQQLKELIREVRTRIEQYDRKLQDLEKERERLQIAQQTLKKDIDTLNNLQVTLATSVASLKNERDSLLKARIEVDQAEKANLTAIAAAYDKMDAAGAGEILRRMAQGQTRTGTASSTGNIDDAVKILRFMQDRTKAKVLAEMATTEPALAAALSLKLKQVAEKK